MARREAGFTLIEVMVALAIAAGSLVLVLGANNANLRRSVEARGELRLSRAIESQFEACLLGAEVAVAGDIEGFVGWRWEIYRSPSLLAELKTLKRVTFAVWRPEGGKALEWTAFQGEVR